MIPIQIDSVVRDIERAFLQNNAKAIYSLLPENGRIQITLPDPVLFSDQLSNQQAFFFFRKFFQSYSTSEFYSESHFSTPYQSGYILKSRWSFRNQKTRNRFGFQIFFYLISDQEKKGAEESSWRIIEIKVKKI